ncbi:MAG: MBL fold metallo-hydrolase [Deltaproteobacteria bacterium]|nr:MBL fold metallo-hydrolase [Deltaproteobacteria bacterium]
MIFRQLFDAESSTYTYLLADPVGRQAVLIDPVFEQHQRDLAILRELGLSLTHTLDTHQHADHITGAWLMKKAVGSKVALSKRCGASGVDLPIEHGNVIPMGHYAIEVRATPGHTDGCVSYVFADRVFTGDALLIRGAGRTDFQAGDAATLYRSIREQIFTLPKQTLVYPAHDYAGRTVSSVEEECTHNPRVGGEASEADFVGYMDNMRLPHPKKIAAALPANGRCGEPEDGIVAKVAEWGPVVATYAGILEIDPRWVAEHRDAVVLLDVRTEQELTGELGKLEGCVCIALNELRDRLEELPKDKPVAILCRSGRRSAMAMQILRKAGFDAANVAGGMLRWRALDLPAS